MSSWSCCFESFRWWEDCHARWPLTSWYKTCRFRGSTLCWWKRKTYSDLSITLKKIIKRFPHNWLWKSIWENSWCSFEMNLHHCTGALSTCRIMQIVIKSPASLMLMLIETFVSKGIMQTICIQTQDLVLQEHNAGFNENSWLERYVEIPASLTHQPVTRGRTIHSHTEEMDIVTFLWSSSLLTSLLTNSCY